MAAYRHSGPTSKTAIQEFIAAMVQRAKTSSDERDRALAPMIAGAKPETFAGIFRQHRVGSFGVECRVLDGDRILGVGEVALDVLFKARFFDQEMFQKP